MYTARLAVLAGLASASPLYAASTWTGATDSTWAGANWSPAVPSATDTAIFSGSSSTVLSHTTIDLSAGGASILNLAFDSSAAAAHYLTY